MIGSPKCLLNKCAKHQATASAWNALRTIYTTPLARHVSPSPTFGSSDGSF